VAGLAGAGKLLFPVGLAVILGADLGSALLIQDLVLPTWLGSAFIAGGRRFCLC